MGSLSSGIAAMFGNLFKHHQRANERRWQETIDNAEEDWNPDYIRSQIIDAEENLHLRELWQRFILTWAILGNLAIAAIIAGGKLLYISAISQFDRPLTILLVTSLLLSPPAIYRQHKNTRRSKLLLKKLHIVHRRTRSHGLDDTTPQDPIESALIEQKRYREELPEVISQYRDEANKYRRIHNRLQSIIIIGSVLTSAVTTASVSYEQVRWIAVAISAIVGLAAGFTGYFKYRERSFNLQQTADAIEREYESVELRVGRYSNLGEATAYMTFANTVENLRDDQNKRQQQLDQPVEVKREQ